MPFHSSEGEKKVNPGRRMSVAMCTQNSTLSSEHVSRQLGMKWSRQCIAPRRSSKVLYNITSY